MPYVAHTTVHVIWKNKTPRANIVHLVAVIGLLSRHGGKYMCPNTYPKIQKFCILQIHTMGIVILNAFYRKEGKKVKRNA
jgi:hypothetical protein